MIDIEGPDEIELNPQAILKSMGFDDLPELMIQAMRLIRNKRLREAKTADGKPLLDGVGDRYAPEYEAWKRGRKGQRRKLYGKNDRLTLTGAMLGSQHVEVSDSPRLAELIFSPEETGKAWGNNRRRMFIEFTKAEIDQAYMQALKHMARAQNKKGRESEE